MIVAVPESTVEKKAQFSWHLARADSLSPDRADDLRRLWHEDVHRGPFAAPAFLEAIASAFATEGASVHWSLGVDASGALVAAWPLVMDRRRALRFLQEFLSDHCTCLCLPDVPVEQLAAGLSHAILELRPKSLLLANVPPWGPTLPAARSAIIESGWTMCAFPATPCPVIAVESPATLAEEINRHKRIKNYENRLKRQEGFAFEVLTNDANLDEWAEEFFNAHEWQWNLTDTPSKYASVDARRRFIGFLRAWAADGVLVRFAIRLNSARVAFVVGLRQADRLVYHHVVTSPAAEEARAGHVLIRLIALWMSAEGYRVLDFGVGGEDYKQRYANRDETLWRIHAAPARLSTAMLRGAVEERIRRSSRLQSLWDEWGNRRLRGRWANQFRRLRRRATRIRRRGAGLSVGSFWQRAKSRMIRKDEICYVANGGSGQPDAAVVPLKLFDVLSLLEAEQRIMPEARAQTYAMYAGGARPFGILEEGRLAHVSWIMPASPDTVPDWIKSDARRYWWVGSCYTARAHRGRGHYPRTLRGLVHQLPPTERVIVYTDTWNVASRRGIVKAGFIPIAVRRRSALSKKVVIEPLEKGSLGRAAAAPLAILGSYPPPYGGVSVHVQRLAPLIDARGIRFVIYNATGETGDGDRVVSVYSGRRTWMLRYFFSGREPAIYLLSDRLVTWVLAAFMTIFRGKRVFIRLRNAALPDWIQSSGWRRAMAGLALRRVSGVVCVSQKLLEAAQALGVPPRKLHWSPGFLPPADPAADRADVNPEVWEFVRQRRPLIAANGKVDWYNGEDLYGLDHLLELAARLKPDYPNIGVVVCMWNHLPGDDAYIQKLTDEAHRRGVGDAILFNTRSGVFVPVLAEADVFIRPTNTDGDANSVREGLYLGVPTLASDAVERPTGTILFRTRNLDDMEAKVRTVLERRGPGERPSPKLNVEDQARIDRYLDLLESLAHGGASPSRLA